MIFFALKRHDANGFRLLTQGSDGLSVNWIICATALMMQNDERH